MRRPIHIIATSVAAALPVSSLIQDTAPSGAIPAHAAAAKVTTRVIHGPSVPMRWGPVQVTIVVKGKRIADILDSVPVERARSAIINNRAVPLLRSEILSAQSANVHYVSGATMTSEAFLTSLRGALKQAHL